MRTPRILAALALALSAATAKADLFNYSYRFGNGTVVSGSFEGTASGLYVTGISNLSASLDGAPFAGSPSLFATAYNTATHNWDNTVPAVVSFDASLNNFLFIDSNFPSDVSYTTYFYMVNDSLFGFSAASAGFHSGAIADDSPMNSSNWTLTTVAAPIPEPETYAMMLAGLAMLGFAARRRQRREAAAA